MRNGVLDSLIFITYVAFVVRLVCHLTRHSSLELKDDNYFGLYGIYPGGSVLVSAYKCLVFSFVALE